MSAYDRQTSACVLTFDYFEAVDSILLKARRRYRLRGRTVTFGKTFRQLLFAGERVRAFRALAMYKKKYTFKAYLEQSVLYV